MNNNGKNLLEIITELDPELITDADEVPREKSNLFIGITSGMATLAAAVLIAVGVSHIPANDPPIVDTSDSASSSWTGDSDTVNSNSGTSSVQDSIGSAPSTPAKDPPVLDFSEYEGLPKISLGNYAIGGMGGGRLSGMYFWEFRFSGPWKGADIKTMPVYISSSTKLPDLDKMHARVKEIAASLGISEDRMKITDNYEDISATIERQVQIAKAAGATDDEIKDFIDRMIRNVMSMVTVETVVDGIHIQLDTSYTAWIIFEEPIELPKEYNFTNNATYEENAAALGYLSDRYKDLMGYEKPSIGRSYYFISDAKGNLTEQITNCWINSAEFHIDEDTGILHSIGIASDGALEKLADYPILTAAQAEAILKSNRYDDEERMPADAKILKTELLYKNLVGNTAVIPYYQFCVETDMELDSDYDIACEVYTIAAVPEEFIEPDDLGLKK